MIIIINKEVGDNKVFKPIQLKTEIIDYGVKLINPLKEWQITKGKGIKVAILDTGIDKYHIDLKNNFVAGINFTTADKQDYKDYVGHGTFCAGLIAGTANNVGIIGIAPECSIYAVKVLDNKSQGSVGQLIKGIEWCINNKIDIINCSLGLTRDFTALHDIICHAYNAGIIICAAAGNNRFATDIEYPAKYNEVIAVGAIDSMKRIAKFNTTGKHAELIAPGVDIISTYLNNQYAINSGTSFSCPLIAGAIALIQSKSLITQNRKMNTAEIRQFIYKNCEDLGIPGYDHLYAYGLFHF